MNALTPRWIKWGDAVSVCSRTVPGITSNDIYPALFEALCDGDVQSQYRPLYISQPDVIIKRAPEWWRAFPDVYSALDSEPGGQIELHYAELRAWLSPTKTTGAAIGRPPEIDWQAFWIETAVLADLPDGLPESQAEFISRMQDWFENTGRKSPGKSTIKGKASKLYEEKKRRKLHEEKLYEEEKKARK